MLKLKPPSSKPPAAGAGGRKPLLPDRKKVGWTVYALPALKEKFARLGGNAWLEKAITKAKEPKP